MPGGEKAPGREGIMSSDLAKTAHEAAELPPQPQPGCVVGKPAVASEARVDDGEGTVHD